MTSSTQPAFRRYLLEVPIILGRINRFYEAETGDQSTWTTYFGGSDRDIGVAVEYDRVNERLAAVGQLSSYQSQFANIPFPQNPDSYQRFESYPGSHFVAFFNHITGFPIYLSRFPGESPSGNGIDVALDAAGNTYVASGGYMIIENEQVGNPVGSYWDFSSSDTGFTPSDCFIMQLDPTANKLWCTLLGGPEHDGLAACVVDDQAGLLYIVGHTRSGNSPSTTDACSPSVTSEEFPLCGNETQYFQKGLNSNYSQGLAPPDGFISAFKLSNRTMVWSTYFGGPGEDYPLDAGLVDNGDLYIVGMSMSSTYSANTCMTPDGAPGFPNCDAGGFYNDEVGGRKHFLARFNNEQQLTWCTKIGDNAQPFLEDSQIRIAKDESGNVIVFGSTVYNGSSISDPVPPIILGGAYFNAEHNDANGTQPRTDCYLGMFSSATEQLYGSYFGGVGNELAGAVEAFDSRIYIGGSVYAGFNFPTHAPPLPGYDPYLDDIPSAQLTVPDGFLAQLRHDLTIDVPESGGDERVSVGVLPNPTGGLLAVTLPEVSPHVQVELFDSSGRSVLARSFSRTNVCELDIRHLANGTYQAMVKTADWRAQVRVLKLN
ncbi:MAG TPA: T9SS type A sorting domain-containing protein, partial [Flavobacteriales bacterium]|nr:T9SS type A sorting domain-containing protein [Flavobacteriales bacterium]